ncbi:hypothetical protein COW36_08740 [bacterium (Candidatus Blackallbacteria) CG17_big_fil_post_rev_8_21_14_2_50_48_46]|uniref:DUF4350 domain-containing protein n=1 Tax=bacterium (Candidatus Blackallbacteria) CG17_big_fil_post_rev_8_21_14_2_50_48_46 TaxID=2014261 RepID=A0A2M7G6D7_9BACT|nr:MAG: hypothetical protein COW64_06040 [bacterium (Candidatus Blackallbacteria) CG18_big_fil_WC_8_21_14_2_50_49_26]PIW17572.1 MAG: hypothetical protein COW36_08740 [bacterium (Candidatus Blackallbacteria) CG17_big_fil_post_rev_8_21_14_2_50_48_46]PIW48427.1 MAG: hypothetical protein COW20_10090 [bacterium (Candidatus Blackallbacteria) CG13_big_fil_rev_8_21_14_2_50_49_14]
MPVIKTQKSKTLKYQTLAALLSGMLLTACVSDGVIDPPVQTPTPAPTGAVTGTPLPIPRKDVQLLISDADVKGISGAEVEISAAAVPAIKATTDSNGLANFPGLRTDTEYSIRVNASGFLSSSRTVNLLGVPSVQNTDTLLLAIKMERNQSTLKGRVTDSQGQPLANAVVFDSKQSIITNANGEFQFGYSEAQQLRMVAAKQGYQSQIKITAAQINQNLDLGTLTLPTKTGQIKVSLDTSKNPMGQSAEAGLKNFETLQNEWIQAGYSLKKMNSLENLSDTDILVFISPSKSFSAEEIGAIQAFVLNGGKLVVLGEWAGFGGFDAQAVNLLLAPYGLSMGADSLRDSGSGYLTVDQFTPHAITQSIAQLKFYQSGSVQTTTSPSAEILARSSKNSFRILDNTGSFGVVLSALYGAGKVVLVGDSSIFSSEDSDGNGIPNLKEADNLRLAKQILAW